MNTKIKELLEEEPYFIDPVPQDLLCLLCKNIMIDSTSIPCECKFCRKCLENYFGNEEKQCLCKDEMHPSNESKYEFQVDSVISHPTNSKIIRLKLKCENCEEVKSVEEMSTHIDNCYNGIIKCLFNNVGCTKRPKSFNLSKHMIDDIESHNQIMLDLINNLINEQYNIKNTMNEQIEENHQLKDEFENYRTKIDSAKKENNQMKDELKICRSEINSIKEENCQLKDEMRNCRVEIDSIKEENRLLKCQNEALESRIQQMTEQMDKIKADQQSSTNKIHQNKENILTNIRSIESRIDDIDGRSKKDKEIILNELILINQYTWTIENFPNKRNQQLNLYSDSFFTHRSGYRIRLVFFTNDTNYNNFAIGFQIMSGKFDDGLPWPMRRQIKVCVIDQDTGEDSDIECIFCFDESEDFSDDFLKPLDEDNEECTETFNYNKIYKGRYGHNQNPLINYGKIIIKCVTFPPDCDESNDDCDNY